MNTPFEMQCEVYNFNDEEMSGVIIPSAECNVTFDADEKAVTVAPMSKEVVTFTIQAGEGNLYAVSYTHLVNDDEPTQISAGMKVGDGYNANWAKYQISAYLTKGTNTLTFIVTDYTVNSKASSPRVVFYFDYFDLSFAESQGIIAEGESYFEPSSSSGIGAATDTTANSALTGDKRYLKFSGTASGEDDTKSAKVKVYAPKSGEYTMNTICTKLGVGSVSYTHLDVYKRQPLSYGFGSELVQQGESGFVCEYEEYSRNIHNASAWDGGSALKLSSGVTVPLSLIHISMSIHGLCRIIPRLKRRSGIFLIL